MSSIKKNTNYKTTSAPVPSTGQTSMGNPMGGSNISASTSTVSQNNSSQAVPTTTAVIGPKIRVKGELVGEEDILVQGRVDGLVDLKNHTLTIGEQGVVNANVLANTITIEGTVEGDLFGQERISILSSSNVKGNLVANRVILEDGAKFRGSIDMEVEAHKDRFEKLTSHLDKSESPSPNKSTGPGVTASQNNKS